MFIPESLLRTGSTIQCTTTPMSRSYKRMLQIMCSYVHAHAGDQSVECIFERCVDAQNMFRGWRICVVSYSAEHSLGSHVSQLCKAWADQKQEIKARIIKQGEKYAYMRLTPSDWRHTLQDVMGISIKSSDDMDMSIAEGGLLDPNEYLTVKNNRDAASLYNVCTRQVIEKNYIRGGKLYYAKPVIGYLYAVKSTCLCPLRIHLMRWPNERPVVSTVSVEFRIFMQKRKLAMYKKLKAAGRLPPCARDRDGERKKTLTQKIEFITLSKREHKAAMDDYMNMVARNAHASPEEVVVTMSRNNSSATKKLHDDFHSRRGVLLKRAKDTTRKLTASLKECKTDEERAALRLDHKKEMQAIKGMYRTELATYQEKLEMRMKQSLIDFKQIWNENAPLSDSLRAVIGWGNEHVARYGKRGHNVFCMRQPKITDDMSFFGDTVIRQLAVDEVVNGMNRDHLKRLLLRYGELQRFVERDMHTHFFLCGPPGSGKSYATTMGTAEAIPGTTVSTAYQTRASQFAVSGCKFSNVIQLQEEVR